MKKTLKQGLGGNERIEACEYMREEHSKQREQVQSPMGWIVPALFRNS